MDSFGVWLKCCFIMGNAIYCVRYESTRYCQLGIILMSLSIMPAGSEGSMSCYQVHNIDRLIRDHNNILPIILFPSVGLTISSAHGCCSVVALGRNQWKEHHKYPPTIWQGTKKLYEFMQIRINMFKDQG